MLTGLLTKVPSGSKSLLSQVRSLIVSMDVEDSVIMSNMKFKQVVLFLLALQISFEGRPCLKVDP